MLQGLIIITRKDIPMSAGKIIAGAIVAMATGAALGVLFAPDSGVNTRKKISARGNRYLGSIRNTAGDYVNSMEETYESARGTAVEIADRVKGAVDVLGGDGAVKHARRS
jgi:gas vesicle protein